MVPKVGIERLLRDDLDSPAQEVFKVEDETRRKPRAGGWPGIDEKVDIAIRPGHAPQAQASDGGSRIGQQRRAGFAGHAGPRADHPGAAPQPEGDASGRA
jgi:hypothetical protein